MPTLVCAGCGTRVAAVNDAGAAARCPRRGEGDVDHVLHRDARDASVAWPLATSSDNPFVRYRERLTAWRAARALGMPDDAFVALAERLDRRIADVDGTGFRITQLRSERALAHALGLPHGNLLVKVEAGNVAGSHKARHLMGLMLMLEVEAWARTHGSIARAVAPAGRLAIASCGNAALAAAVVARAAGRALDVFVPTWAGGGVVERLQALGATINACARTPGVAGDPCYHGFTHAIASGATPFCCQGPDNGLTIEGGETLAWEIVDACAGHLPDAVFVQVGGGALASAVMRGFLDAQRARRATHLPRLHAVQTEGCAPLVRAYDAVVHHVLEAHGTRADRLDTLAPASAPLRMARAHQVATSVAPAALDAGLHHAATHRSAFMWPWEQEPHSAATGILDDETYDWLTVVDGMLRTGGYPVLASEATLARAHRLAHDTTGIAASTTGTAGLAGLMDTLPLAPHLAGERIAVVFSGRDRRP